MPWKVFHKPALQVGELKLYKRKDKTYIHLSKNMVEKKPEEQDATSGHKHFIWINHQTWNRGLVNTLLKGKAVSTASGPSGAGGTVTWGTSHFSHMINNIWSKPYFCKIRSWQHLNHISQNGSSSRAVKTPDMFHHLFVLLPTVVLRLFRVSQNTLWWNKSLEEHSSERSHHGVSSIRNLAAL